MMEPSFGRNEVIGLVVRLSLVSAVTFFSIKWIMERVDPVNKSKKAAKQLGKEQAKRIAPQLFDKLTDYELLIAQNIIHPPDITVSWSSIAGLESLIDELRETVILPIQKRELFQNSQLIRAPKGVLLHGPPGCGKTLIAKATAKEAGTAFINLDVSLLTDKWYGESQKLAAAVFSLAVKLQPCIIFIDEIDSFLRARNSSDHEATAMMKAQFMSFWDGLITDPNVTVIIMGATNRPQDLDAAILRRMPATFHIPMPTLTQRAEILRLILESEPKDDDFDVALIARKTDNFSGSDLRELCRMGSMHRVRDYLREARIQSRGQGSSSQGHSSAATDSEDELFEDALRPISMQDMLTAIEKMKNSKRHCGTMPIEFRLD